MARRRDTNAPYYAEGSRPHNNARTRNECTAARLGCRALALPYKLTRVDSREMRSLNRELVKLGEREQERREKARKAERAHEVPEANTSWGVVFERIWEGEDRERSRVFQAAVKSGSAKAVKLAAQGKVNKALDAICESLTG